MNQNLLIVDDENEILTWLAELFRHEFDMEIGVYTAPSAIEAMKLLAKVRFDVVLADIRMPGMDGITLFFHIKENWPRCKTVFLTAYPQFDDVYRVANHRDVKYILKSETDDVIMAAVRDFLILSKQELEREKHREEQQYLMEDARYWLKRAFMNQLCNGNLPDDPDSKMETLGIPLRVDKPALPLLLRIERGWKEEELQLRFEQENALKSLLQENVPLKLKFYVHIMENNQQLLLVQPVDDENVDWNMVTAITQGAVEYAQEQFRNLQHVTVSALVGQEPIILREIAAYLKDMKKYMIRYVGGAKEVVLKMDISELPHDKIKTQDSSDWVTTLKTLMEMRKKEEYFVMLRKCLKKVTECQDKLDTNTREIYYSIAIFLLQFINSNHLKDQLESRIGIYKLTMVDAHGNWTEAARYLSEVSERIFALLETDENDLADHALKKVVKYVENHLDEDLSLTTLADVGGFNASYLSRLFKQVYKETISDFILHKRMDLAKDLLANTNVKIQDVAAKTGYLSPHSFARAFRNEVGISPTDYRTMKM